MEIRIKQNLTITESGLILNPETSESFITNPVGLEILRLLKEKMDYPAIERHIIALYDTEGDAFRNDFLDFIECLRIFNFLEPAG
jgi:hypothetical protein